MMNCDQEFQDIYESFNKRIHRYLARIVGETEAEDLAQEVFVKISRGLKDFRGESGLSTWIYAIATNTARDRLRSLSSRRETAGVLPGCDEGEAGDEYASTEDNRPSPEASVIRKEMNECIRGFVEGLPEDYREVLVLSEFEGFTNAEISAAAGISLDTVKIRLHRARACLRKELAVNCVLSRDERNEMACDRRSPVLLKIPKT